MKRFIFLLIVCALMMCLAGLSCAQGEEEEALYPIRENGLWGYMNRAGETVIAPKWDEARPFDGKTAMVSFFEGKEASVRQRFFRGIIDRSGVYLIDPGEGFYVQDNGLIFRIESETGAQGFVDKASGFYLPVQEEYRYIADHYGDGSGPLAVENDENQIGYLDRTTGEVVFPFRYGEFVWDETGDFMNGYALLADGGFPLEEGETDPIFYLIDLQGEKVPLPDGMMPVSGVWADRVVVMALDEDDGWLFVYGLVKTDGTVIVEPSENYQYIWPPDDEGMVCFMSEEWRLGHMDRDGHVIVPPRYRIVDDAWVSYFFKNGYAVIKNSEDDTGDTVRWVILTPDGREIFSELREQADGGEFWLDSEVQPGGLLWYQLNGRYGLMRVKDDRAEYLTGAVFDGDLNFIPNADPQQMDVQYMGIEFSEGLYPVRLNGLWGYIDENAQWAIPPQYQNARNFRDGLAPVIRDGKLMYIDHDGNVVWKEKD
ncbi:MAG: WG repeat-containing protein [Clostridium sp.]|nr:WG repeat-containing protein [Clostridium sp.]